MEVRLVTTPPADSNNEPVACYVAIELSKSGWLVGFLTPLSDKTGRYQVKAGDAQALLDLIERVHARVNPLNQIEQRDRKSTRLNSSHQIISYAVFCLKKKNNNSQ